jgi:hypothetical protein
MVNAQVTEVFGRILDAKTQEPIAYANVRFVGQLRASNTDDKGYYRIKTPDKVDSISFSYLGYTTFTKKVRNGKYQELSIELSESDISLGEVTVKAGKRRKFIDTPAMYVYAQVVSHKDKNREDNAENYHYMEYHKFLVSLLNSPPKFAEIRILRPFHFLFENVDYTDDSSKFIPGLLKESVTEVFYRKNPKDIKKIVKADAITGVDNESVNAMLDYQFDVINPYDNLYVIAGKSFQSPFAPGARVLYRYYITDTAKIEGRTTYKLHFVAKNKEDIAMKGYAWVDSITWGLKSIKFRPNEKANLNFLADYSIEQSFILVNGQWVMASERLQSIGSLNRKKNKMAVLIQKLYQRKDYEVNIALPDSMFKGVDEVVFEDSAKSRGRKILDTLRFEELTPQERLVYYNSDTLLTVPAFKRIYYGLNVLTTAMVRIPNVHGPIEFGRFYQVISRNSVEGYRLRMSFRTTKYFSRSLLFSGYAAYGLGDKEWKYSGTVRIMLPSKTRKWNALQAWYQYDLMVLGQENLFLTFDNSLSLLSRNPLKKVMKVRIANFQWEKDWSKGLSTMIGLEKKTYYSIPGVFNFSYEEANGATKQYKDFTTTEVFADFRYSYKDQNYAAFGYRYFQQTKYPAFNFRITAGSKGFLEGDYNYLKFNFLLKHRLQSVIGYTKYQVKAGYILGKTPYPNAFVFTGSLGGVLYDFTSYNLMRTFEFSADKFVSIWLDHHFDGFFLNKIPGIKKLQVREFITFKALIGHMSKANRNVIELPSDIGRPFPIPYIEAGFGFDNILKVIRIDFIWRCTYRDDTATKLGGFGKNWGIKIGFTPKF